MAKSEIRLRRERLEELLFVHGRYVDVAFQFRLWRRVDGAARPGELLPTVYGGRYDKLLRLYVPVGPDDPPLKVQEISCHEGQLPLLLHNDSKILRLLALGTPGVGKTFGATRAAAKLCAMRPNSIGGMVGPTNDRRLILWRDFLELVEPLGWVKEVRQTRKEIVLVNGTVVQVLAASKPSHAKGNPLQGRSWDWCVADESQNIEDEAHAEIATRGRRAGTDYKIFETCTNQMIPEFRLRLERLKEDPQVQIVKMRGRDNPWITPEWWERLKGDLSDREYRQLIEVEDLQPESLVYSAFSYKENVQPLPVNALDITAHLTQKHFNKVASYIVGQDFGVLVNASIILKAFQGKDGTPVWWVIDELTTYGQNAEVHGTLLKELLPNQDDVLVIADPHINTKEVDKSDYHLFRKTGWTLHPATHYAGHIPVKHRISMMNTLFRDAHGVRRLFLDCDATRRPRAKKFAEALMTLQYDHSGRPQPPRKDRKDMTHWPDGAGYGVFPFERLRGNTQIRVVG